jgi:cysteine synthase A
MAKIFTSIDQLVGRTPLMELTNIERELGLGAKIYAKLELFNPAGSVKDRVALRMLDAAEADGRLKEGSVVIEPTSGNTGIGLAAIAASRGYRVIIVMPDTMSVERRKILAAYGAELVLTDGSRGIAGAIERANELAKSIPGAFVAGQFENSANPEAHFLTTGPEIYEDTDGELDVFVAGVGTGGTISGTGNYLKSKKPGIEIVAVEPSGSPYLSEGRSGPHNLQGIGAGMIPKTLDTGVYDRIVTVCEEDAYATGRMLGKSEGILVGISSGAALFAAISLAKREEYKGKRIVVLLPDTGDRYLSTQMFSDL